MNAYNVIQFIILHVTVKFEYKSESCYAPKDLNLINLTA